MAFAVLFLFYIFGGIAASGSNLENFKCGVRYELAAALKREGVCTQWTELHPLCKRNIVVAYSEAAPYVHSKDGEVHGVIPDDSVKSFSASKRKRQLALKIQDKSSI
eukprot:gene2200-17794_t